MAGIGDDSGLGWVGRAVAVARAKGANLSPYNLGVRRDTSTDIVRRAEAEIGPRLSQGDAKAVIMAFGSNDLGLGLPLGDTLANARSLIETSRAAGRTVLFVSPPAFSLRSEVQTGLAEISRGLAELCAGFDTPYLDLRAAVPDWSIWREQAAKGDGAHPNAEGYALIAQAFNVWAPWQAWLAT